MELLRRATVQELQEKQELKFAVSWNRLCKRALLVSRLRWYKAVFQQLLELWKTKKELVPTEVNFSVSRSQLFSRQTLKPSQSLDKTLQPDQCIHSAIVSRGNGTKRWWACVQCSTRWPGEQNEVLLSSLLTRDRGGS